MSFDPTGGEHRKLLMAEQIERPAIRCPEFVGVGASQKFTGTSALVPGRELFDRRIGKKIIVADQRFVSCPAQPAARPCDDDEVDADADSSAVNAGRGRRARCVPARARATNPNARSRCSTRARRRA